MAIDCAHRAFVLCLSPSQMRLPITGLCSLYIQYLALTSQISRRNSQLFFCNTDKVACYLFLSEVFSIKLLSSSSIPYCSKCCCCSFSTNLFSLWLPFSQSLPSLQAFSPTLLHYYSLCLSPTLSFILSLFSLPITW